MKMSCSSYRSMVMVDLSGSSYVIFYDDSAFYSMLPIENDFFMSVRSSLFWKFKKELV